MHEIGAEDSREVLGVHLVGGAELRDAVQVKHEVAQNAFGELVQFLIQRVADRPHQLVRVSLVGAPAGVTNGEAEGEGKSEVSPIEMISRLSGYERVRKLPEEELQGARQQRDVLRGVQRLVVVPVNLKPEGDNGLVI